MKLSTITIFLIFIIVGCKRGTNQNKKEKGNTQLVQNSKGYQKDTFLTQNTYIDLDSSAIRNEDCDFNAFNNLVERVNSKASFYDQDATLLFQTVNLLCIENSSYLKEVKELVLKVLESSPEQFAFAFSANISTSKRVFILNQIKNRSRPLKNIAVVTRKVMQAENTDSSINRSLVKAITSSSVN